MESIQDQLMQQFQNMDRAYEAYARSKGFNYLSLVVLEEIYETGDGCTQKQISEDTLYPKQSVNLVVKSFAQAGYVELREQPENRKNKQIFLTAQGRALCARVIAPLLEMENRILEKMGGAESRALLRLLSLYSACYCEGLKELL